MRVIMEGQVQESQTLQQPQDYVLKEHGIGKNIVIIENKFSNTKCWFKIYQ